MYEKKTLNETYGAVGELQTFHLTQIFTEKFYDQASFCKIITSPVIIYWPTEAHTDDAIEANSDSTSTRPTILTTREQSSKK